MTLKNNRAPLLSIIKLYVSFHHHMWIQNRVTVRKQLSWVLISVTLTFDLWPWPFAWTSLLSLVITPENFMMIRWWEHGEKGVTDGQTDGQTDRQTDGLNQSYSCLVAAKNVILSLVLQTGIFRSSYDNVIRWMPQGLTDDESTLGQVMAWCRQATSHYLSQCWPSYLLPYPQWTKAIDALVTNSVKTSTALAVHKFFLT